MRAASRAATRPRSHVPAYLHSRRGRRPSAPGLGAQAQRGTEPHPAFQRASECETNMEWRALHASAGSSCTAQAARGWGVGGGGGGGRLRPVAAFAGEQWNSLVGPAWRPGSAALRPLLTWPRSRRAPWVASLPSSGPCEAGRGPARSECRPGRSAEENGHLGFQGVC